ncbi:hypothetical protein GUITHDRAFT_82584 [Guillardia theta CCMP2712]|uniref:Uncharacterized protein n=1 Tax=Guillardia theta (strain CCMP2712) TaxID=905079 RepID=L1I778_GUITC|nr:hypothetical protein GUITHDRAFT_82584 [Guillardia theta CCMP2712]EKX32111.1 hypothetical protein GUITHDRAFT_82584 [Guillardia theta CCMP2712]|eukprot:XP_005819091.1 hypothetical protein GUITHDRAFT_82584 [Guillardia theta CCMP2712]
MDVDRVIEHLFPNLDAKKKYIAEQAIAAVVYHQDWLRKTMPANHPLFETELFSYHEFLPLLSRYISIDGNGRRPTGLPPHVMTIRSMEEMKGAMEDVMEDAQDDGGEVEDETVNDNAEGDESRLLPTNFKWVKANARAIYTQWHFGNREKGYPAYKTLKPRHFYTKDQKKRLSDLRYLVREIEIEARALGVFGHLSWMTVVDLLRKSGRGRRM